MNKSDFFYELPPELIAQTPLPKRDASRLLCLDRVSGTVRHGMFAELPNLLRAGDLLVLNDSRVLLARLIGHREGRTDRCELLLLREVDGGPMPCWECLVRPGRRLQPGAKLVFGGNRGCPRLLAVVMSVLHTGHRLIQFHCEGPFLEVLEKLGEIPLPPYIHEPLSNPERYQTVYAAVPGSAAAPTAGLHFTAEIFSALSARGVEVATVTLHVGAGTFRPVTAERVEDHVMHSEFCELSAEACAAVARTRTRGGRVIAVGTTACRVLESFAEPDEAGGFCLEAGKRDTNLFITPGYTFRVIDGLLTNFHLPESTLIMLVSALAGRESVMAAYRAAVLGRYRFFSFGDAMLIV